MQEKQKFCQNNLLILPSGIRYLFYFKRKKFVGFYSRQNIFTAE